MDLSATDKQLRRLSIAVQALAAAALLSLLLVAWWALIRPVETQRQLAAQRMVHLETTLAATDDIHAEHASLRQRLTAVREHEASLKARIPDEPSEEEFLALTSRLAGETGLTITDYRPGKSIQGHSCSSLEVQLIGNGSYMEVAGFLDGLSQLPRLSTIASLHIDAAKNKTSYQVEISILLYFGVMADSTKPDRGAPHV